MRRAIFRKGTHQTTLIIGVFQTVKKYTVLNLTMSKPGTTTHFGQQIRRLRHTFHSAHNHDLVATQGQLIITHHCGFHARATHFIDRCGRHILTKTRCKPSLPGRSLALTRRQNTTHQQLIYFLRRNLRRLKRSSNRHPTQLTGRHRCKCALKPTHRCSSSSKNINCFHQKPQFNIV